MNKKEKSVAMVYGILFLIFNVVYLGVPFCKTAASWIIYVFTLLALVVSFFITAYAFKRGETLSSKVYGFPIFRVSYLYLGIQFLLCVLVSVLGVFIEIATWIPTVSSIVLLGLVMVGLIATDNARDVIQEMEHQVELKTRNLTYFRIDMDDVVSNCDDMEVKKELMALAEEIRYSDPVSADELEVIEQQIGDEVNALKGMIKDEDRGLVKQKIKTIRVLLEDRNRRCKLLK